MSLFAGDLVVIFHSHHLGSYKKVSSKQASENNKEKEYRRLCFFKDTPLSPPPPSKYSMVTVCYRLLFPLNSLCKQWVFKKCS